MHAEELQRQAMGIYRRAGDLGSEAEVLSSLGGIAAATDDPVRAEQYLRANLGDGEFDAAFWKSFAARVEYHQVDV